MNLNGKQILITGGAGFVGSNLIKHLMGKKCQILVLDNFYTGKKEFIPSEVEFINVDIRSREIKDIITNFKPDIIIHLAAIHYIPQCNKNPEETFDVNVMGTRNVLEASESIPFFFASSAAVYPPFKDPLSENVVGPMDVYGKTKLVGEDLVKHNQNAIIGRFFNVYGPNETNPHVIPEIIEQIRCGNKKIELGNLTPKRDYIHVDDICEAIISLLKNDKSDTYNIGTGTEYSVNDLVNIIAEVMNEDVSIIQDKKRMRSVERENLLADISKIRGIGWKPRINLKEGIKKTLSRV